MNAEHLPSLSEFIPINSLSDLSINKLEAETPLMHFESEQKIFTIGDTDNQHLFLLKGDIILLSKDGKRSKIEAGSMQSRYAIANLKPRLFSAIAGSPDVIISAVNAELLDKLMIWDNSANDMGDSLSVDEYDGEDEVDISWRMSMLKTQVFLTLPAENILSLFNKMQEVTAKAGDVIISQGEPGDYYYILKEGRCQVTRDNGYGEEVKINDIEPLDSFGEEALVTGLPRNATVSMVEDGVLMRLNKDDFHHLMQKPLLHEIDRMQANRLIREGSLAIDVRMEEEYRHSAIKNTYNLPLYLLRLKMPQMDKNKSYVLFCDTGARSAAAAFLLKQNGFNKVHYLKDGLPILAAT